MIFLWVYKTNPKPKCIMGTFRKGNRLVSSPECLGVSIQNVMHGLITKQT